MDDTVPLLDRIEAAEALVLLHGPPSDPAADLLVDASHHMADVLTVARTQPFEGPAVGFESFWGHVSALVREGGAAFADDIVGGAPVDVAAVRHGVDPVARSVAHAYVRLVQPIRRAVEAVEGPASLPLPVVPLPEMDPGALVEANPPQAFGEQDTPSEQARPGHGWPASCLAPPVAA